jgi:hypothetical protein
MPETVAALRRACEEYVRAGRPVSAARAAYWIVFALGNNREFAQAAGWLARAVHLLESQPPDCAEHGLVLGAMAFHHNMTGEYAEASEARRWLKRSSSARGRPASAGYHLAQRGRESMWTA